MSSSTILNLATRATIDGTESLVLATAGANWKAALGTSTWVFGGVAGGTAAASVLTLESTTGAGTTDMIVFNTGSQVERMRIETDGQVTVGGFAGSQTGLIEIIGNGGTNNGLCLISTTSTGAGGVLGFQHFRTHGANPTTQTIVAVDDDLGGENFWGSDGAAFREAAEIICEVDAAPAAGSMPGRMRFLTTPASTVTPVERVRIDSVGRCILGGSAALAIGGNSDQFENLGTDAATGGLALGMFSATAATCAHLDFYRSKNATLGSATVVASGDAIGSLNFYGAQQTGTFATQNLAAQIIVEADTTVTSGAGADMPGRLRFLTTPDASGTPAERMRITSGGVTNLYITPSAGLVTFDAAPQTGLTISVGSNASVLSSGQGALIFVCDTNTQRTALFLAVASGATLIAQDGSAWSVTTTPASGNYGLAWSGSDYKVYNNAASSTGPFKLIIFNVRT